MAELSYFTCIVLGVRLSLVPRSVSSVKVKYQGHNFQKVALAESILVSQTHHAFANFEPLLLLLLYISLFSEAVVAIKLNCQENIGSIRTDCSNLIGVQNPEWSTIILGDMFYDETFSNEIIDWLSTHYRLHETNIFIGDPGRIPLLNHPIRHNLVKVAEYKLLKNCIEENHGCTVGVVWKYEPRLWCWTMFTFGSPLPDDKILDWSKFKGFANDFLILALLVRFAF